MSVTNLCPSDIHHCLFYNDAPKAIDWLCRAFGFTKRFVVAGEGNRIEHSELSFGTSVVMIGSSKPKERRFSPMDLSGVSHVLSVYVNDPDAHYDSATIAGAQVLQEPKTEEYGARGYLVKDLEGHIWYFGNYRPGEYWET